jgi:hypothetical protein
MLCPRFLPLIFVLGLLALAPLALRALRAVSPENTPADPSATLVKLDAAKWPAAPTEAAPADERVLTLIAAAT